MHKIKVSNVSLTPLLRPISEMTERLRTREDIDYSAFLAEMFEELDRFRAL